MIIIITCAIVMREGGGVLGYGGYPKSILGLQLPEAKANTESLHAQRNMALNT
jgi:hypothetical protein